MLGHPSWIRHHHEMLVVLAKALEGVHNFYTSAVAYHEWMQKECLLR